ncbi:polyamine ABC transporter ATP-binding protein [Paralimibaculum aggregatum]|uniref:Spermidine/putrescine import ATP-binding protein PotA n=1 Tax=Paralimibaculum aggregatum TaxID=3036245 RepID=A0ABQ6LNN2_9RHOB|nr:ABC transporter ATP-binding protein [Limibaculum sp. NKW23]GMG84829.1 polyamine ABC transporter ATP-binding protein [Limibaculum sp. NKW23]
MDGVLTVAQLETEAPLVRFRGVQKSYDGRTLVVRNLDLEVRRGTFLTLLGPSGSGKTTTLMMLAGFESVTEGTIELSGRPINDLPPYKRGIGMVFQSYALFPHMTVAENVAFPLDVRHIPRAESRERVEKALATVRLEGFMDRRPTQLSGGQQQRVALARALVFEPELILLDEPLGALDRQLREQMQYELKQLHDRLDVTMIYVTHDQQEALTMSDEVAVFSDGVMQQVASPGEIYERPRNLFVAQFVGENNQLAGRVIGRDDRQARIRLESGDEVSALAVDDLREGDEARLAIRPERILIGQDAEACDNRFSATLSDVIFLGDQLRGHLAAFGSQELIFKQPNSENRPDFRPGQEAVFGWGWQNCRAFRAGP